MYCVHFVQNKLEYCLCVINDTEGKLHDCLYVIDITEDVLSTEVVRPYMYTRSKGVEMTGQNIGAQNLCNLDKLCIYGLTHLCQ